MTATVVSSSFDLARTAPGVLEQAMLDGAARHPGRQAAVWLLTQHGRWVSHPLFLACVRMQRGRVARIQWAKFAQAATESGASLYDTAIALSACLLAGATLAPEEPAAPVSNDGVLARDRWACVYCGDHADTVDHVIPVCRGGKFTWGNLVAACQPCNVAKGDQPLETLGWHMRAHRSIWSTDRIQAALGDDGRALVTAAEGIRDLHAAQLTLAIGDGYRAALGAMNIADRSPRSIALIRELADRLIAEIGDPS